MPRYRYLEFDAESISREKLVEKLLRLFNHLLLQTNGDVEQALRYLEQLGERWRVFSEDFTIDDFRRFLEANRTVQRGVGGGLTLTPKGEGDIRRESLDAIFGGLQADASGGQHRMPRAGTGQERLPETRPYTYGDSLSLVDVPGTLTNALRRSVDEFDLREEDLQVYETEHLSSCATVLLVDISHSMILYGEDRITPAKRVAMALCELIRTRYPKDSLEIATFGDEARRVAVESIPYIAVGPFHTNTRAALILAREMLRKKKQANRQIFLITDGKPSALTEPDGTIYKNPFGLDERVVNKTLDEAVACRRYGIPVTTFMLTEDPLLVGFVEEFTEANQGRAYYSQLDRLGSFLFVDYIKNRRRSVR